MLKRKLGRGDSLVLTIDSVNSTEIYSKETAGEPGEGKKAGVYECFSCYSNHPTRGVYLRQVSDLEGNLVYSDLSKNPEFPAEERLKIKESLNLPRMGYLFFRQGGKDDRRED